MLYGISNFSFFHLLSKSETPPPDVPALLNERTGELRTNSSLRKYVDGYCPLEITATNEILKDNQSTLIVKMYVVRERERGLLRFVFAKSPSEVNEYLSRFESELENALAIPTFSAIECYCDSVLLKIR